MTSDICILPLALWQQFGCVIADINKDFANNNTSAAHSNLSKLQVMYDKITRTATRNDKIKNKKDNDVQSETKSNDYDDRDDAKTTNILNTNTSTNTNTIKKSIDLTLKEMKVEEFEQMMDKIESDNEAEIEKQSQHLKIKTLQTSSKLKHNEITIDFNKCFCVAFDAAIEAGKLISDVSIDSEARLGIQNRSKTKLNHADIVTEIDKASEKLIIGKLKSGFGKDYFILGEESADNKDVYKIDEISKNKPVWCIDPIDGTTNFYFGLPMTCIAIGLRYKCQTILGIVYNPIINELFFAIKGSGSYLLNTRKLIGHHGDKDYKLESMIKLSERLQTSSMKFLPHTIASKDKDNLKLTNNESDIESTTMSIGFKKAMIIMYAGYGSELFVDNTISRLNILLKKEKIRGLRMLGSCAIGMCYVACGRCHLYFEGHNRKYGIKPWDVVAAQIIVTEAGGNVYLPNNINGKFDTTQGTVLACNNQTAATVFQQLNLYKNSSN